MKTNRQALKDAREEAQYWLLAFKDAQAEIAILRRLNESLAGRLAAACEVLGRKANRLPLTCPHCSASIVWEWENEP